MVILSKKTERWLTEVTQCYQTRIDILFRKIISIGFDAGDDDGNWQDYTANAKE